MGRCPRQPRASLSSWPTRLRPRRRFTSFFITPTFNAARFWQAWAPRAGVGSERHQQLWAEFQQSAGRCHANCRRANQPGPACLLHHHRTQPEAIDWEHHVGWAPLGDWRGGAAIPGLGEGLSTALTLFTEFASSGGLTLGQSFVDRAFASAAQNVTYTVPVTAITNSELNYQTLNFMAGSIEAGLARLRNHIDDSLTNATFVQSVLSNFGLIQAFGQIDGAALSGTTIDSSTAVGDAMTRSAINKWFRPSSTGSR